MSSRSLEKIFFNIPNVVFITLYIYRQISNERVGNVLQ